MYKVDDIVWVILDSEDRFINDENCDFNDLAMFKAKISQVNKNKTFHIDVDVHCDDKYNLELEDINSENFFISELEGEKYLEECSSKHETKLKPINKEYSKAIKALLKANALALAAGFDNLESVEEKLDESLFSTMNQCGWNTSSFYC